MQISAKNTCKVILKEGINNGGDQNRLPIGTIEKSSEMSQGLKLVAEYSESKNSKQQKHEGGFQN